MLLRYFLPWNVLPCCAIISWIDFDTRIEVSLRNHDRIFVMMVSQIKSSGGAMAYTFGTDKVNEQVLTAWALLEAIRRKQNVAWHDQLRMHAVMREFAVEVVRQQTNTDRVVVAGQTLMHFPNKEFSTKQAYLEHHSNNGVWGDDPLLFSALEALGYQAVVHLANTDLPPYVPYVQQCDDSPLRCDIVNYGAKDGGYHWESKGQTNPGGGNCLYYTLAQQVQKDFFTILPKLTEEVIFETEDALNAGEAVILPVPAVREDNVITREIKTKFIELEEAAEARKAVALELLNDFSTETLVELYRMAMTDSDYLPGRLKAIEQERGVSPADNIVRKAVEKSHIDSEEANPQIREELLHALSIEAWKNPKHYNALCEISKPGSIKTCSEEVNAKIENSSCNPKLWRAPTLAH